MVSSRPILRPAREPPLLNQIQQTMGQPLEPSPGYWGKTPEEYRANALDALEMRLDMYESPQGIVLGPEGEQPASAARPIKEFRSEAARIREAIEKQSLRFILGEMPNGCRSVGILVIEP